MDSHLCTGHRDARLLDYRVVDKEWRKERLPQPDIEVSVA